MSFSFLGFPLCFPEAVATLSSVSDFLDQEYSRFSLIPSASICLQYGFDSPLGQRCNKMRTSPSFNFLLQILAPVSNPPVFVDSLEPLGLFWLFSILSKVYSYCLWRLVCCHLLYHTKKQNSGKCSTTTINNYYLYHYSQDQSSFAKSQSHRYPGQVL